MKPGTRYVHESQEPDALTGAVTIPITLTSTFKQDGVGRPRAGWEYGRTGNPSRRSLEGAIAAASGRRWLSLRALWTARRSRTGKAAARRA